MARSPRRYRAPLVITLAATLGPACGQADYIYNPPDTSGDGDGDLASGGTAPSGGEGGGDTSSGGVTASGGHSSGGNPPEPEIPSCPSDPYLELITCSPGDQCTREMDCTSGEEQKFLFTCDESGEGWSFKDRIACYKPWEYCDGSGDAAVCNGGVWIYEGAGGNPPAPCPEESPELGSECQAGYGFGADRTGCGYPCGDEEWTVLGCVSSDDLNPYGMGTWQGDGACSSEAGGAGGAGN
ncbi:MAG TPA: hypothetical protein VN764_07915 [Polyangiaceae bacterium]|nr:hypothetical protein [Polyangiaceae bacterium]